MLRVPLSQNPVHGWRAFPKPPILMFMTTFANEMRCPQGRIMRARMCM